RRACLATARVPGFQLSTARTPRHRARRGSHPTMEASAVARDKKKALRQGRQIVFVDESGLSTRPTRVRTWAPRGQTPLLQETFNWKSLSLIGGMVLWQYYFQLYPGSIKSLQVVQFLKHLQRHVAGKLLVLWDGAS